MKQERAIVNKIALKIKKAYAAISKVSNGADEIAETGKYMERVSKDVRKLPVESSNSLKNITTVLVEIKDAVSKIAQGIYKNAEHTSNQANALKEIEDSISNIQLELDKFYKNRRQSYY